MYFKINYNNEMILDVDYSKAINILYTENFVYINTTEQKEKWVEITKEDFETILSKSQETIQPKQEQKKEPTEQELIIMDAIAEQYEKQLQLEENQLILMSAIENIKQN